MKDRKTVLGLWAEVNLYLQEEKGEVFTALLPWCPQAWGRKPSCVPRGNGHTLRRDLSKFLKFCEWARTKNSTAGQEMAPEHLLSEFSQDTCSARSEDEPVLLQ